MKKINNNCRLEENIKIFASDISLNLITVSYKILKYLTGKYETYFTDTSLEVYDYGNLIFQIELNNNQLKISDIYNEKTEIYTKNLNKYEYTVLGKTFNDEDSVYNEIYIKKDSKYTLATKSIKISDKQQSEEEWIILENNAPLIKRNNTYYFNSNEITLEEYEEYKKLAMKPDKITYDDLIERFTTNVGIINNKNREDLFKIIERLKQVKLPKIYVDKIIEILDEVLNNNPNKLEISFNKYYGFSNQNVRENNTLNSKVLNNHHSLELQIKDNKLSFTYYEYDLYIYKLNVSDYQNCLWISENNESFREYKKGKLKFMHENDINNTNTEIYFNESNEALIYAGSFYYFAPHLRIQGDRLDDDYEYSENYYLEEISKEKFEELKNNTLCKKRKLF